MSVYSDVLSPFYIDDTLVYRYIACNITRNIAHSKTMLNPLSIMERFSRKLVLLLVCFAELNSTNCCPQVCLCESGKYTCSFQVQSEIYFDSTEEITELFITNSYITNALFPLWIWLATIRDAHIPTYCWLLLHKHPTSRELCTRESIHLSRLGMYVWC